jgi:nitroreductase/NAD-dependent dihydropyrimidine dehydrogenase PreA subunit
MSLITVDEKKCTACRICNHVCPVGILKMDKQNKIPVTISKADELCINCGHCVSVCPYKALSLDTMKSDELQELGNDWKIPSEKLETFLKARRSIRNFKEDKVEKEKLEKLIDIARYAPTGLNRQPVRWMAVHDNALTRNIAEAVIGWMRSLIKENDPIADSLRMDLSVQAWEKGYDRICRGAPHLIIGYALKEDMTAPQAAAIGLTYLELAAVSLGLGACWAGYVNYAINSSDEVRKIIGLSKRSACFGAMLIGYPAYEYKRIPKRNMPSIKWK